MGDRAIFTASFADLKIVRTRSVAQIVLEIDLAHAQAFVAAFGMPLPGVETPVAIARLEPDRAAAITADVVTPEVDAPVEPAPPPKAERAAPPAGYNAVQDCAMRCAEPHFQRWLVGHYRMEGMPINPMQQTNWVTAQVRGLLGIQSRKELATNTEARDRWIDLVSLYSKYQSSGLLKRG